MSKIVNISDTLKYQKELERTLDYLEVVEEELRHRMFVLATLDKWKDWSNKQEPGTTFSFTDEMLQNTGDKNIDTLFNLKDKVQFILDQLGKG